MKQWTLAILFLFGTSLAMARTFQADDFNQMMKENQKIEQDLRNQLQKEAGISLNDRPGHVAKEKITAPAEVEPVVVNSSRPFWSETRVKVDKAIDKEEMKRISQEMDEALEN